VRAEGRAVARHTRIVVPDESAERDPKPILSLAMRKAGFLLLFLTIFGNVSPAAAAEPSAKQVRSWLASSEKFEIEKMERISLRSGEEAFLAGASFPDRGRNFSRVAILIRPRSKEARELDGKIGSTFSVVNLSKGAVSFVSTEASGSGQGSTEGVKSILYFDAWTPIVMLEARFSDNLGNCGKSLNGTKCESSSTDWTFADLDGDGNLDVIETTIEASGSEPDKLRQTKRTIRRYVFRDMKLVPMERARPAKKN
jgi:hypothetical protein